MTITNCPNLNEADIACTNTYFTADNSFSNTEWVDLLLLSKWVDLLLLSE